MAQATVDRIEGDFAVLILCNGEIKTLTLPSALLPDGCREGDIVSLTLERDPRATQTARNRVAETIERLQKR